MSTASPRGRHPIRSFMTRWGWLEIDRAGRSSPLTATAVFDGPIDNATFRAYVEQVLVPTLRRGDVVVISSALQPDFNPLELAFTKLNAFFTCGASAYIRRGL